jgi:hypothetical protein
LSAHLCWGVERAIKVNTLYESVGGDDKTFCGLDQLNPRAVIAQIRALITTLKTFTHRGKRARLIERCAH